MLQSISAARARALQGSLRLRAAGASSKGGAAKSKKSRASDAHAAPVVSKELREKAVLGANILKDGSDPQILPDSEYPEWLNGMLEKRPPLSELQRRKPETMSLPELVTAIHHAEGEGLTLCEQLSEVNAAIEARQPA